MHTEPAWLTLSGMACDAAWPSTLELPPRAMACVSAWAATELLPAGRGKQIVVT
jgi:hypothetical protein